MAALDFPDTPTIGQVFDRWTWNGTAWVLTAGGAPTFATQFRSFTAPAATSYPGAAVTTHIPFVGVDNVGNIGNRAAGFFSVTKGLYTVSLEMRWSTTFATALMQMDFVRTDNSGGAYTSIGSQLCGPSAFGVTRNTFVLDHDSAAPAGREYAVRIYNNGTTMTASTFMSVAQVSSRP